MKIVRTFLAVFAAAFSIQIAFGVFVESSYAQQAGLFAAPVGPVTADDREASANRTVFRSRLVTIDPQVAADWSGTLQSNIPAYDALVLNLFDDVTLRAVLERRDVRSSTSFTWVGRVEGMPESRVTLVMEGGTMAGNIRTPGGYYQVRYVAADLHAIRQIDETRYPEEDEPIPVELPPGDPAARDANTAAADDGSTFDVLVVYTGASRSAAGGTAAMDALINLAVAETNDAYARSGIIPRLRLVHTQEVAYNETNNLRRDLDRLTDTDDGFMDNVHSLRNTHGADLVSLIVEATSACGIAWVMRNQSNDFKRFAFSVVERTCATGNFTFGHELGHNMGLQHDRADTPGDGVFSYSHGYVDTVNGFRTIMGVQTEPPCCFRIQNFSNPNVNFGGVPTGVPAGSSDSANAAASINNVRNTVANWRAAIILFNLTVNLAGPGSGRVRTKSGSISCGADCSEEFRSGARVLLTPAADPGSVFRGWSGACSGKEPCTVTMNGDKNVTATFAPRLTLAPATLPSGQVGTAYSTSLVPAGGIPPYTVVNIGALPRGLVLAGTDISGTPTKTGLWTFTIRVRDDLGGKVTREYNLRIRKAAADMSPALNTAAARADTRRMSRNAQ